MPDSPNALHTWLDQVEGVVVLLDRRGAVVYANAAMLELVGWERHELVGRDWFDTCLPAEVRVPVRGGFAMIISGELEPMAHYTNEVITKSGEPVAVSWSNSLLREGGDIVGTLSLGQPAAIDVASADALRAARYEQLFDATPVGVLGVARDGTVLLANAHASLLLHRPVEQVAGLSLAELIDSAEACRAVLDTPMDGRTDLEVPLALPDRTTTWARCTARTGVDPVSEEPVIRVGLLEADAERQDREALAQLAHELSARNADLRRFADVLAHDLKGPLQAMVGRLEMLQGAR